VKFRDVFAVREFRALWAAQLASVAGDQLARVALTVLVYTRTGSALLAAVTFVASVVPVFVGGVTLARLADRFPRRLVMIAFDAIRCALVLVMAIPAMPLALLIILLCVVTFAGAPFTAARAALYPDVLTGERYVLGTTVTLTTNQFAQVLGFALGGTAVGFLGVRGSLVVDAATFAVSALIVGAWVRRRPTPVPREVSAGGPGAGGAADSGDGGLLATIRFVFGTAALRWPMLFGWLAAFYNAPEGIAAPLASHLGGGAASIGVILAAQVFGESAGVLAFGRMVRPKTRLRWMGALAVAACAVLGAFALLPTLGGVVVILAASGAFGAYQLAANASFVNAVPPAQRGRSFGLAQGGMSLGQGTVMIVAGAAAERFAPTSVIAVIGAAGAVCAILIAVGWNRANKPTAKHART
jgi:MFS family permease